MPGIVLPDRMNEPVASPPTMGPLPWYQTDEFALAIAVAVVLLLLGIVWRSGWFVSGWRTVGSAGPIVRPYWREVGVLALLAAIAAGVWL